MEISEKDITTMKEELYLSLLHFSNGKIEQEELKRIADKSISLEILKNDAFAHKGINWYAKLILKQIGETKEK